MKPRRRCDIQDRQSESATTAIRLRNGSVVPLEVITSLPTTASQTFRSAAAGELERETDFRKFADGTLMELVRDSSGNLTFGLFQNGTFTLHSRVQDGNLPLVPPQIHRSLKDAICFPMAMGENHTAQELLGQINDAFAATLISIPPTGSSWRISLCTLGSATFQPLLHIANAHIKDDSQQSVEYAIRMPGTQDGEPVLLPVDAKFPREAWERLEDAQSRGDQAGMKDAGNKLEAVIRASAKTIKEKYVVPPRTTSFAVMFLPTEGLFAEVVRRPGLVDDLQANYHVCLAGPTTFAALLTSLQMGFRTLAIQKKGSEVWKLLSATKVEFEKFGGLMAKVEKQVGTCRAL